MNLDSLRRHCLAKPEAAEDFPFGPEYPAYRLHGRIFALLFLDRDPPWLNLKCHPDHTEALRTYYPAVRPGYHMNKRHWNTVVLDGSVSMEELLSMVDDSFGLVQEGLPGKRKRRKDFHPSGNCRP
jgi:predicted DNA-binding protein (MmcQ/YjbR family)